MLYITAVKRVKVCGWWWGEFYLSLVSGRDVSSQQDLIKKKEGVSIISEMNMGQLYVMKQHILGHCFNSWYTLVTYVGCSSIDPRVHSVSTHHPPPQPTSFSLETSLCFWFCRHAERVLTSQLNKPLILLPFHVLLHMQFSFLHCIKAGIGMSQTRVLQTPPSTHKPQDQTLRYRTSRNEVWVFLLSRKQHWLCNQQQ